MEGRSPIRRTIFEILVVYNMTQMLLNVYVFLNLLWEARAKGFKYPWGNKFQYTKEGHSLGYIIWLHYHCCQLELLDTVFVVIRKKFQKLTFLHVWLRVMNMWGWFFACRYACGGDTYFPAAVNAATRAAVYAFYSISLVAKKGMPLLRKARVTGLQIFQFGVCAMHALYCLYSFWNDEIPRALLVLYFLVMMNGLMLFSDFHYQVKGKSEARARSESKVSFAFDSSGWLYCYHFGVATWLREHLLPQEMTPEESLTDKYPSSFSFSGCSGGALVAATLSLGLDPKDVFEMVVSKQPECKFNPFRMLPAVEDVLRQMLPVSAWKILSRRCSVLLTRISWKYPFFTAEVAEEFEDNDDVFHALRGSCHMPVVGGMGPYCYKGGAYFDGMFWPQMFVPWRGKQDDFVVRISALTLGGDVKSSYLPLLWSVFPPEPDVLRGLYWIGYSNAARWFSQQPSRPFECWSCRRVESHLSSASAHCEDQSLRRSSSFGRRRARTDTDEFGIAEHNGRLSTWLAARKVLLKEPGAKLPDLDPKTGRKPSELMEFCQAAIDRDRRRLVMLLSISIATSVAWFVLGCL
jgi:hypothetical protein